MFVNASTIQKNTAGATYIIKNFLLATLKK